MRIRLAILDRDARYLERVSTVFNAKYSGKLEVCAFTDLQTAVRAAQSGEIDVFLADTYFETVPELVTGSCSFAYLVESSDIEKVNGQKGVCKYQRIDMMYRQILNLYSDGNGMITVSGGEGRGKLLCFSSPCGGTGTSSMAAACAIRFAKAGKKTLYLNLETLGDPSIFFSGEGQGTLGDLIYALKSQKGNFPLKLESCVRCDKTGVYYYEGVGIALDMLGFTDNERLELIDNVKGHTSYEYIIADMDFSLREGTQALFDRADTLVWVGDGSKLSNGKLLRAYEALAAQEQEGTLHLTGRICIVYNKFSNKTGRVVQIPGAKGIGGTHRIEHAATAQIISQLSALNLFDQLL